MLKGMDVVAAMSALPRVKDNTNSPFFRYGKATGGWLCVLVQCRRCWIAEQQAAAAAVGDKRADVAQRAFKKAFNKIVVDECGVLT